MEAPIDKSESLLVVLDMNGVVLEIGSGRKSGQPKLKEGVVELYEWLSRHSDSVEHCFWTSRAPQRATECLAVLRRELEQRGVSWIEPLFVLNRDHCLKVADFKTVKDLRRIWNNRAPQYGPHNTVVFDDSPDKLAHQPECLLGCGTPDFVKALEDWLAASATARRNGKN